MTTNTKVNTDDKREPKTKIEELIDDEYLASLRVRIDKMAQELDGITVRLEKKIQERKVILKRKRTQLDAADDLARTLKDRLGSFKLLREKVEDQMQADTGLNNEREEMEDELSRLEDDLQDHALFLKKTDKAFQPLLTITDDQ
ncbi:hypothetical protein EMPS_04123 [Entomortierella parvispora]|uniref:Uncharacterized protein n=1 Tax=Entomortierella parvispora TaxID=205924 RepID=A0A9P3H7X0_9FUNG|nr:hypothetical protein EMPS_04123 [Entomortierella parvispora]